MEYRRDDTEERGAASYGRVPIGAFLPDPEFGSGPVDDEIGGGSFEGSGLTPLERVLTESRPGRAPLNRLRKDKQNGMANETKVKSGANKRPTRSERKELGRRIWSDRSSLEVVHRDAPVSISAAGNTMLRLEPTGMSNLCGRLGVLRPTCKGWRNG